MIVDLAILYMYDISKKSTCFNKLISVCVQYVCVLAVILVLEDACIHITVEHLSELHLSENFRYLKVMFINGAST